MASSKVDVWLTRPQVAERYDVAVQTVAHWASQSIGPRYTRIGGRCRYRLSDLEAWEAAQPTGGEKIASVEEAS